MTASSFGGESEFGGLGGCFGVGAFGEMPPYDLLATAGGAMLSKDGQVALAAIQVRYEWRGGIVSVEPPTCCLQAYPGLDFDLAASVE